MEDRGVPIPVPDADTSGYWTYCRQHALHIQRCLKCRRYRHFPLPSCPSCGSMNTEWAPVSGRGIVYSFTIVHQTPFPGFRAKVPYAVAWVELPEQSGLRMLTQIVDTPLDSVKVGASVRVTFEDINDEIALPQFRVIPV